MKEVMRELQTCNWLKCSGEVGGATECREQEEGI